MDAIIFLSTNFTEHEIIMYNKLKSESENENRKVYWYCNKNEIVENDYNIRFFSNNEIIELNLPIFGNQEQLNYHTINNYMIFGIEYYVMFLFLNDHKNYEIDNFFYCENDVYYNGNWKTFLKKSNNCDLFCRKLDLNNNDSLNSQKWWLYDYSTPLLIDKLKYKKTYHCLLCFSKISIKLLNRLKQILLEESDKIHIPHFEALIPSVAKNENYTVKHFNGNFHWNEFYIKSLYNINKSLSNNTIYHPIKNIKYFK